MVGIPQVFVVLLELEETGRNSSYIVYYVPVKKTSSLLFGNMAIPNFSSAWNMLHHSFNAVQYILRIYLHFES